MLEGLDAEYRAGRSVGQADCGHVLDAVHAPARAHVTTDVWSSGEQLPQVGVFLLALDLVGAKLEDRARTIDRLGHQAAKRLVVVAHRRGSSLSRAGREARGGRGEGADRTNCSHRLYLVRIIEPSRETVKAKVDGPERRSGRSIPTGFTLFPGRFSQLDLVRLDTDLAELCRKSLGTPVLFFGALALFFGALVLFFGALALFFGALALFFG